MPRWKSLSGNIYLVYGMHRVTTTPSLRARSLATMPRSRGRSIGSVVNVSRTTRAYASASCGAKDCHATFALSRTSVLLIIMCRNMLLTRRVLSGRVMPPPQRGRQYVSKSAFFVRHGLATTQVHTVSHGQPVAGRSPRDIYYRITSIHRCNRKSSRVDDTSSQMVIAP